MNCKETRKMKTPQQDRKKEAGFSYLDVLVAITILSVGIVGLTSAILFSLMRSYESEQKLYAKQIAQSTIESIFAARDIQSAGALGGWGNIGNVGTNPDPTSGIPQGIFVNGWTPVRLDPGADGVLGTADDTCAAGSVCQVGNNPPNTSPALPGYLRQIVITDVDDPERPISQPPNRIMRRQIVVTVQYQIGNLTRQEALTTFIVDLNPS
jgi:type II secretory pathway pseudopilin PulG